MFRQRVLWVAAAVLLFAAYCDGYICYTCQISGGDPDTSCLDDASTSRTTDCTKSRYCQTIRIQYAEGGDLYSFARLCSPNDGSKPQFLNETYKDSQFTTHYTACDWDKCNKGDGIWSASSGKPPSIGVPGIGFKSGVGAVTPLAWMTTLAAVLGVATVTARFGRV